MNRSELTKLLPRHRDDVENARAIVALGFPVVEPVLRSLFQWLETSGSNVELVMRPFFAALGEPALDLAREALIAPIKPARKFSLLRYVLPAWPSAVVAKLEPQLLFLMINGHDDYGLDVWALKLLLDKKIDTQENLEAWRRSKISRLRDQLGALELAGGGKAE
jgi:hypothetical protein